MTTLDVALRLRLLNQLSAPAKVAAADVQHLTGSVKQLSGVRGGEQLSRDIDRAGASSRKATREIGDLRREATGLRGGEVLARDLDRAAGASRRTKREVGDLRREAAGLKGGDQLAHDLDRAAASIRSAKRELVGLRREADRAPRARAMGDDRPAHHPRPGRAEEDGSGGVVAFGRRAAGAAAGYYTTREAIRKTVGEAITFEQAMAEVKKKVNDAPGAEGFAALEKTIKQIAIDLGIPQAKVAQLAAEAGAAGIAFAELERFTRLAAKASAGWDMTPEDAAGKLAGIKAGTNATIAQMEVLADKINGLGDNSAAKERDIVEMFGRSGAAAKAAGVDFDTTLAFLTALRSAGMQEEVGARFFSAITGKLATAGAGGKGAKDLGAGLEMLGLSLKTVSDGMKSNPAATLLDLLDRLNKAPDPAKAALKIGGGEWWDELARLAQARAEVVKQLDYIRNPANYKNSLQGNLDIKLATTGSHLERLKALSGDVGDRLGRWALPPINTAIEAWIHAQEERKKQTGLIERYTARENAADPDREARRKTEMDAENARTLDQNKAMYGDERGAVGPLLTWLFGRRVTTDPSRAAATDELRRAGDQDEAAKKARAEASLMAERARGATGPDRTALEERSKALSETADTAARNAVISLRGASVRGARDMTGVEAGEDLAGAVVEGLRRRSAAAKAEVDGLRTAIAQMEAQLAQPRVPDRDAIVLRLETAKKRLQELGQAGESEGAAVATNIAAGIKANAPKIDAEAQSIWQRVKSLFSTGVDVPVRLKPEAGEATPSKSSFGGAGGGATVQKASFGGNETFPETPAGRPTATIGGGSTARRARAAGPELSQAETFPETPAGRPTVAIGGGSAARRARAAGPRIAALPRSQLGGVERSAAAPNSMLDLIARSEGTAGRGDYDTVLGYGRYGGKGATLTDKTLNEVYGLGRQIRARHGSSSALGRYQIVGRTMKGLAKGLGLDMGTTRFTPEVQDRMASRLLARRGRNVRGLRNEWEGLRRVPDKVILDTLGKGGVRSSEPPGAAPAEGATPSRSAAPLLQSVGLSGRRGGGRGGVSIQTVHLHGVRDLAHLERQVQRAADRSAKGRRDDALHDIGDTA